MSDSVVATISQNNTTTVPLLANQIFIGLADVTVGYSTISITLTADTDATITVQQSLNRQSNWDVVSDPFVYTANMVNNVFTQDIVLPFFRVLLLNTTLVDMTYNRFTTTLFTALKGGGESTVTVVQPTAANLNATVVGSVAVTGNTTVVQPTAANLNAVVSQPTAANLNATVVGSVAVTGNTTVVQPTASNLNAVVSQPTAANLNAVVSQPTAANLNATVVGSVAITGDTTVVQPTAANLNAVVSQPTAANLNATVVGSVSVTGDTTVVQPTAANLNAVVSQPTAANLNATVVGSVAVTGDTTVVQPTASNLNATVVQPTASNLNATVVQPTASNLNAVVSQPTASNLNANVQLVNSSSNSLAAERGSATTGNFVVNIQRSIDIRAPVNFYATAVTGLAIETLITLTKFQGLLNPTSTATSFTNTLSKILRLESLTVSTRGNATASAQVTTFNLRYEVAFGTPLTAASTPVLLSVRSATPATASAWDRVTLPIGIEITGTGKFGISAISSFANAPTLDVVLSGFEY